MMNNESVSRERSLSDGGQRTVSVFNRGWLWGQQRSHPCLLLNDLQVSSARIGTGGAGQSLNAGKYETRG